MSKVLEGVRVLDFGRYIAGPFCAALLADMGAEVIRIERIEGGEDRFTSPVAEDGSGAAFLQMGRNKLGMTLNPIKPEGREVVQRLVKTADVVIANLPPQTLKAMGIDYESLTAIKPDIILTWISTFGSGGPYSNRLGFDGLGQAMSGNMHLTGPEDHPVKAAVNYVDFGTASLSAYGTMAALLEREKTGKGQIVEASLYRTALNFAGNFLTEQSVLDLNRHGTMNRLQNSGPGDTFRTRDGWVLIQTVGNAMFERWARLMGEDHWLSDPRFKDDISRGDNGEFISERLAHWCLERTTAEVLAAFEEAKLPAGTVYDLQQALDDEHAQAVGAFKDLDYPGTPRTPKVVDTPVKLSRTNPSVERRAPTLSEHTHQIMTELGYSQDEIAVLREKRII
ncbi:CaiB/BaiF CoA transferase family protein [Gilvimarinus sp. F26214L]|uniref:CaiB/BaiF CoA transferase family protein n=1 Tax=Gilvimarinus sp. DZF01 TaxID=3461371 RepID=UPI0040459BA7